MSGAVLGALPWLALVALVLTGASGVAAWSYGRFARRAVGAPSAAIPAGVGGALDALIPDAPDAAALITDGPQALAIRLDSIAHAQRSIDVMTYIWTEDRSGRALAAALIRAAGRGVRVRLLLDDVDLLGRDPLWLALDRIPGIEVRLFNPVAARASAWQRVGQMGLLALRYNRRMHGKLWLADGRVALAGGRNLGDEYFGVVDGRRGQNFTDAELLLTGPIVAQTAALFDRFWNSDVVLPIAALWSGRLPRLPRLRPRKRRPGAPAPVPEPGALTAALQARRPSTLTLIADPPDKALAKRGDHGWVSDRLDPVLASAQQDLRIITPYLVPGAEGLAMLTALRARGVRVRTLTNALAVADHAVVHGAYRWYRGRLEGVGVELFEYLPLRSQGRPEMLHAKAAVIDGDRGFVGSFNFDQRSAWLNTELGVLFDDPHLVAQLGAWIDTLTAPDHAYTVRRVGRWTAWQRGAYGARRWFEPQTRATRRIASFLVGHLPIHRLL